MMLVVAGVVHKCRHHFGVSRFAKIMIIADIGG